MWIIIILKEGLIYFGEATEILFLNQREGVNPDLEKTNV